MSVSIKTTSEPFVSREWVKMVIEKSSCNYAKPGQDVRICSLDAVRAVAKGENYWTIPVRVTVVYATSDDPEERRLDLFAKFPPSGKKHETYASIHKLKYYPPITKTWTKTAVFFGHFSRF